MSKNFYAKTYPFGKGMLDANSGHEIYTVVAFKSRQDRDEWVAASQTYYHTQAHWREATLARNCRPCEIEDALTYMDEQYEDRKIAEEEYAQYHPRDKAREIALGRIGWLS